MPQGQPPNHGQPSGLRLAPRLAGASGSQVGHAPALATRSPRPGPAPRIARTDSPDLNQFSAITQNANFNSHPSRRPPTVTGSLRSDNGTKPRSTISSGASSGSSSPMFFRASKGDGLQPAKSLSKPPISSAKFFYSADGRNGSTSRSHSPVRDPPSQVASPQLSAYTPAKAKPPHVPPPPPIVTPAPHVIKYGRPDDIQTTNHRRRDLSPDNRPVSPLYDSSASGSQSSGGTKLLGSPMLSNSPPKPSYLSHPPVQPPSQRNSYGAAPSPIPYPQSQSRRQSVDLTPRRSTRASSVSGYGEPVLKMHIDNPNAPGAFKLSPKSPVEATPLHAIGSAAAMIEHQKELAAAARRERKIMDLEISNTSLLAINKQFERRISKQAAEIRRFKRLARAGLLSSDKFQKHKRRSSKEQYSESEAQTASGDEGSDEGSEDEFDLEDEDEEFSESSGEGSGEEKDPEREKKRKENDQKHLASDIARHRALLEASAKMNASLKRCQTLAETLIDEGKKQLETEVKKPEPRRRGPRVVDHDDDGAVTESELDMDASSHFQDPTDDEGAEFTETDDGDAESRRSGYSTPTYFQGSEVSGSGSRGTISEYESRSEFSGSSQGYYSEDYESQDDRSVVDPYEVDAPDVLTPRVEEPYPILRLAKVV